MVNTQDVKKPPQDEFLGHEIEITDHNTSESIRSIKSQTPIPVPGIGEDILLSTLTLTAENDDSEWIADEILPEEGVYHVERVGYEYMAIEPDESARDDYREGFSLRTHIRVTDSKTE